MIIKKYKKMKIYKRANWERKTIPYTPKKKTKNVLYTQTEETNIIRYANNINH